MRDTILRTKYAELQRNEERRKTQRLNISVETVAGPGAGTAVPLGQTAGQKMLLALGARLEELADVQLEETSWSNFAPGLACLSVRHETQYSRLFRS